MVIETHDVFLKTTSLRQDTLYRPVNFVFISVTNRGVLMLGLSEKKTQHQRNTICSQVLLFSKTTLNGNQPFDHYVPG